MTNQEIIETGQTIATETHIGGNTAERVGGVIEGIGENLKKDSVRLSRTESVFDALSEAIRATGNNFIICDGQGNILARFDSNGLNVTDVRVLQNGQLVSILTTINGKVDKINGKGLSTEDFTSELKEKLETLQPITDIIQDSEEDKLCITDPQGNVIAQIDSQGIKAVNLFYKDSGGNLVSVSSVQNNNHWNGKKLATYGDSVTAINNGDFTPPYDISDTNWGNKVASYFSMAAQYGRGIGGQGFRWVTGVGNGGSVSFINADGTYNSRNDNYNYDNYTGSVPSGCTKVRGCMCSWLRITTMFPASIKDTIDVILIMAHNDNVDGTDVAWVESDNTDTEWAASSYYSTYGGDYNINTLQGGIASTIMKLQAWMPQACLILMTPISGRGNSSAPNSLNPAMVNTLYPQVEHVKVIHEKLSIPLIDMYGNDGINGLNRTTYIADIIHPYTVAGSKMLARTVVGGMKSIMPMDLFD